MVKFFKEIFFKGGRKHNIMISSVVGSGYSNLMASNMARNVNNSSFGKSLSEKKMSDDLFNITQEQKEYLKKKYGSSDLNFRGDSAKELMEELRNMGAITDSEYANYDSPSWSIDVDIDELESGQLYRVVASYIGTETPGFMGMDIRDVFRLIAADQNSQSRVVVGKNRQHCLDNEKMYKKLAGLMDYIFK